MNGCAAIAISLSAGTLGALAFLAIVVALIKVAGGGKRRGDR